MLSTIASSISSAFNWTVPEGAAARSFEHRPMGQSVHEGATGRRMLARALVMGLVLGTLPHPAAAAARTDTVIVEFAWSFPNVVPNSTVVMTALKAAFPEREVHLLRMDAGNRPDVDPYIFPRNIAQAGPDAVVLSSAASFEALGLDHWAKTSAAMLQFLTDFGIDTRVLALAANMANLHYDEDLDLLVIAHSGRDFACRRVEYSPDCADKTDAIVAAFGTPEHIVQLVRPRTREGNNACYDLDLFFHLATNARGDKVALVYEHCIRGDPPDAGMGRKQVIDQLRALGVMVVKLLEDDFQALAANAISPERGKLLFTTEVSDLLKRRLAARGIESIVPDSPLGNVVNTDRRLDFFGIHCLTLEVPRRDEPRRREEL